MKKPLLITLFISTHVALVVMQIYKSSQFTNLSYLEQHYQVTKKQLEQKKQLLTQQLYASKSRSQVKTFAQQKLDMKPIDLVQVQKISAEGHVGTNGAGTAS